MLRIISDSERKTIQLGARLAHVLGKGDIICLFGNLGAGKTILTKGIAKGLGINKDNVISPSFVIIREYPLVSPSRKGKASYCRAKAINSLYHFDLYRLNNPRDILNLGYEEYLYGEGVSVIEWAERMAGYLPAQYLKIQLGVKGDRQRAIKLVARGARYRELLSELSKRYEYTRC
ncbi:MAG: tRNA (adenosine(37)-N6)-threonylcarbamoyltransferase complex ATPase subunit type 1 TsaE [Candidatus Omnitrophota bacterium]